MKRHPFLFLFLNFVFFSAAAAQSREALDTLTLSQRISLLNDRGFLTLPARANVSVRPTDIMSADPNPHEETRIVLDIEKTRVVFFAQEMFGLAGHDLLESVQMTLGKSQHVAWLKRSDALEAVISRPLDHDSLRSAIPVGSIVVCGKDRTLYRISAFVNPDGFHLLASVRALMDKVFNTLEAGERFPDLSARTEKHVIFGTDQAFLVNLPKHCTVTIDRQYDFQVMKFNFYRELSDPRFSSLVIYTGHHPSYFHGEYGFQAEEATRVKGRFLEEEVEWLQFTNDGRPFFVREQQIPAELLSPGMMVHIAMMGDSLQAISDLQKMVENIRVEEVSRRQ